MKELYEEVTEVKFYHDPFKGYADNYFLDAKKNFADKAEYKKEKIVCNSFDELWNVANEKCIHGINTGKNIFGRRYIALNLFYPIDGVCIFEKDKKTLDLFPITIMKYLGFRYDIKAVSQYLSASEFCDYLKEHGINGIIID